MTTFPVDLATGVTVQIGGEPLGTEEKIRKLFPDLWEHVLSKDLSKMDNDGLEEYCFHIVKHFNPSIEYDSFAVDHYGLREIVRIFMGREPTEEGKKN